MGAYLISATHQRDQVAKLAKLQPAQALTEAQGIKEPWFRAQALAWVARYSPGKAPIIASEAALAACQCEDDFKRVAVRAWEIAALGESGAISEALQALQEAMAASDRIVPIASKAEALMLLLQAAARVDSHSRELVHDALKQACGPDSHWRCKRALRDAERIRNGELQPRVFFW